MIAAVTQQHPAVVVMDDREDANGERGLHVEWFPLRRPTSRRGTTYDLPDWDARAEDTHGFDTDPLDKPTTPQLA